MNVNTTNNTFRQLMGFGQSYCVPPFQRNYSWGADEWNDLWQDIIGLFGEDPEPAHYMGYLVLQSVDNKTFDIIDGQQRIATLNLLMLAAVSHLTDLAVSGDLSDPQYRRAQQLRSDYIDYLDLVSLVMRSRLTLNRQDDGFYQNYLISLERMPQLSLNASEHLLCRAFIFFKEHIKKHSNDNGEAVVRFVNVVVDKLFFTVTTVTDELNAFKVFETMNARGLYLSTADLLKNYLFSVISQGNVHESELKTLENRWEAIVGLLGSESCLEFLYVFWNSRNRFVRKKDLFKTISGAISDRGKTFALIRDMDRYARVYTALCSPKDNLWRKKERDNLAQLQMFSVRQPLAVLMAVYDRFAEDDRVGFGRFLRAIAVVSFRYNVICGRQSNEQEAVYNQIACGISEGRVDSIAIAIAALRPVYPGDGEFRTAFANKVLRTSSSRNKKIARFILFRMEEQLSGKRFDFESAKYSIEHVLPENPGDGWEAFDDRQREASTYRLGNMTLLETDPNRRIGNARFSEKHPVYGASAFSITHKLSQEYDTWTVDKVRSRQEWMARQATGIWQI